MKFKVPGNFDMAGFIAAAALGGVTLEKSDAVPDPDGFVELSDGVMHVHLCNPIDAKRAIVAKEAIERGAQPI